MLRSFIALYVAVFFLMTGVGLLGTYLPLRLTIEGASAQVVGYVMSSYFFGMFIGAFYCHRLVRSVGHIRAFAAFAALTTAIVMLHGMYIAPLFWGMLRFLAGLSTMGIYMVIESWLNECAEPQSRGRVLSIYMVLCYLGMSVGQQLLNVVDIHDPRLFFIVGLMLVLSLVPLSVTHSIHPEIPDFKQFNVMKLFRKAPVGMLGCFSAGLMNSAFYSMGPVFCHQVGLTVTQLSMVMTVTIFGGLLLQWPVGTLSDRFDRTFVLSFIGMVIALLCVSIIVTAEKSFWGFLLAMTVFGGLIFTVYPVAVARAHDVFDVKEIVPASSVLLLCYGIGATAGPIFASMAMMYAETAYGLFGYCALVAALYGITTYYLRKKEIITVVLVEDNTDFVVTNNTSPMMVHIDPRNEIDTKKNAAAMAAASTPKVVD